MRIEPSRAVRTNRAPNAPRTALLRLLAAFLACATWALPALARDLTAAERSALTAKIETFSTAMAQHKADVVVETVPPRVIDAIAKTAKIDPAELRKSMVTQTAQLLDSNAVKAFVMKPAEAKFETLKDGTPYALVPTTVTVDLNGQHVESSSDTLAVLDGGKWYLLDLSKTPQVALFTQVYPDFAGIQFGGKTTKVVP